MSAEDVLLARVRERVDGALFLGKAPPTAADLARDLGVSLGAAGYARGVVIDSKRFAASLRPVVTLATLCVCGHELQDHTRAGVCTDDHPTRAGHRCVCRSFVVPARSKAWPRGEMPVDILAAGLAR